MMLEEQRDRGVQRERRAHAENVARHQVRHVEPRQAQRAGRALVGFTIADDRAQHAALVGIHGLTVFTRQALPQGDGRGDARALDERAFGGPACAD
jgi:hypothetical protein